MIRQWLEDRAIYSGKGHTSCSPALSDCLVDVVLRRRRKQLCTGSHLGTNEEIAESTYCACRQQHQSDPASDRRGAMSEHCTAGMNGEQVYRTERANVSWWPKQGNIRPRSGVIKVPFPHIGCAPRQSEAGGRSEKSS